MGTDGPGDPGAPSAQSGSRHGSPRPREASRAAGRPPETAPNPDTPFPPGLWKCGVAVRGRPGARWSWEALCPPRTGSWLASLWSEFKRCLTSHSACAATTPHLPSQYTLTSLSFPIYYPVIRHSIYHAELRLK